MPFEWRLRAPWCYRQLKRYSQYHSLRLLKWIENDCLVKCNPSLPLSTLMRSVLTQTWHLEYSESHRWPGSHSAVVKCRHPPERQASDRFLSSLTIRPCSKSQKLVKKGSPRFHSKPAGRTGWDKQVSGILDILSEDITWLCRGSTVTASITGVHLLLFTDSSQT